MRKRKQKKTHLKRWQYRKKIRGLEGWGKAVLTVLKTQVELESVKMLTLDQITH